MRHRTRPHAPARLRAAAIWLLLALSVACGGSDSPPAAATESLQVASFDFAESELLAEFYAQIAESADIPVTRLGPVGPREIVSPAQESGVIDLVPEYLGTALRFAGSDSAPIDPAQAADELAIRLRPRGMVPLAPSAAEDVNVFVVASERSRRDGLVDVSDLASMHSLRFGGPVECPDRPLCLVGLSQTYGVEFDEFIPQSSLMFTAESLRRGEIDVGLLFSTSPELDDSALLVLRDNLHLQPPENLIPIIRAEALERWGPELAEGLNWFGSELSTDELRRLNRRVLEGESIERVVKDWLHAHQRPSDDS